MGRAACTGKLHGYYHLHDRDWSSVENRGRVLIRLPILDNYYDIEQQTYYVLSCIGDNKY